MTNDPTTISDKYRKLQQELHDNPNYGVASLSFAATIANFIKQKKIQSVSDYGAGKKNLLVGLKNEGISNINYLPYDPAFPEYGEARAAELVCCIDVLEHIEPEYVDNVIRELFDITIRYGFFSIHMGPAQKTLSDGRNAHLIQKPSSWWLEKLVKYFDILHLQSHQHMGHGFWVIVMARDDV